MSNFQISVHKVQISDIHYSKYDFFDVRGESLLGRLERQSRLPLPPLPDFESSLDRTLSISSVDTIPLIETRRMDLLDFCGLIRSHRFLRHATIRSSESYTLFNGRVVHRFLVLELLRVGKPSVWLRLDRRPATSLARNIMHLGSAPAHDEVCFPCIPAPNTNTDASLIRLS